MKLKNDLTANGVTFEGQDFLARLSASDPQGETVFYTLVDQPGNYLPRDFFLDPSSGVISGKASLRNFANTTTSLTSHTWSFFVRASNEMKYTDQSYEIEIVRIDSPPIWINAVVNSSSIIAIANSPTNLGNFNEQSNVSIAFNVIDPQELPLTYSISDGAIPSGFTLDTSGYLRGTVASDIPRGNTISNFTIMASDGNTASTHDFIFTSVYVNKPPVWNTPNSFTAVGGSPINFTVSATQPDGYTITYAVVSRGNLPSAIVINNNVISGTLPIVSNNTAYTFTMSANDGIASVDQLITINSSILSAPPVWISPATGSIGSFLERQPLSIQFVASDSNNDPLVFSLTSGKLPSGLNLSSSGKLSGTPVNSVDQGALTGWFLIGPPLPYGHWDGAQTNIITPATDYMSIDPITNNIIFTSKPSDAPFVTTDSSFFPEIGKTYKITYFIKKTVQETNGIKSYMKPAFDASYTNGTLDPALGSRIGYGYNSTTDSIDTSSWIIGQIYEIGATWSPTNQYASAKGRIRVNRSEPDSRLGTNPYSNAVFEIVGQNIEYVAPTITYNFTVSVSDNVFAPVPRDFSFIIGPNNGPPINTTVAWNNSANLGTLSGGSQYSFLPNITVTNQVGDTFYELRSGTLPNGTSLDTSTGVISGTLVNAPSSFSFTLRATNNSIFSDRAFNGSVVGGTTIAWNSPNAGDIGSNPSGEPFSFTPVVTTTNPVGATVYSVVNGAIPPGTSLNATTGAITGTLSGGAAEYSFTIRATNNGAFEDRPFVTWVDTISLSDFDTSGITSYPSLAGYKIGDDGKVMVMEAYLFREYDTNGIVAHDISNYEVRATPIFGSPSVGNVNTWINVSYNQLTWMVESMDFQNKVFSFTLEIRKVGTIKILDSINVVLSVDGGTYDRWL